MSQEKLVTEILKERARELAFEGHRWFDLRRTTRPEIKKEIEERDYQDTHREISPLKKAEDAIELDTSSLTLEEVVEQVLTLIQKAKEE